MAKIDPQPDEAVAYGRIDTSGGEQLYIGKHGITADNGDLLVINTEDTVLDMLIEARESSPDEADR